MNNKAKRQGKQKSRRRISPVKGFMIALYILLGAVGIAAIAILILAFGRLGGVV